MSSPILPTVGRALFDWAVQCSCWLFVDASSTSLSHVQPQTWSTPSSSNPVAGPAALLRLSAEPAAAAAAHQRSSASSLGPFWTLPRKSLPTEHCSDMGGKMAIFFWQSRNVDFYCKTLTSRWRADRGTCRWNWRWKERRRPGRTGSCPGSQVAACRRR